MKRKLNILFIEDDEIEVMKLNRTLNSVELKHVVHNARDGEEAFVKLFQCLKANRFVLEKTKNLDNPIPSCHYILGKDLIRGDILPGIKPLDQIPSPYLTGVFDELLLDERLMPIVQNIRGCPYRCRYCVVAHETHRLLAARGLCYSTSCIFQHLQQAKNANHLVGK